MNVYEGIVLGAVIVALVVLFGVIAYQNHAEKRNRLRHAPSVQERLEQLNRHRGHK